MSSSTEIKRRAEILIKRDRTQDILKAACIHVPQNAEQVRTDGVDLRFRATTRLELPSIPTRIDVNVPYKKRICKPTAILLNELGIPKGK